MSAPPFNGQPLEFFRNRRWPKSFRLFEGDGSPLELGVSDVVRARIWDGSDADTPYVSMSSAAATSNGSTITVNELGDEDGAPDADCAKITILVDKDDAVLVPVDDPEDGVVTYLEITVARAAAATEEYPVHRCVLKVKASPT